MRGQERSRECTVTDSAVEATQSVSAEEQQDDLNRLEEGGEIAADYLEGLLDIADLDGDIDMDVEGDRAAVSIVGTGLDQLIGQTGEVLQGLQEVTRVAVRPA